MGEGDERQVLVIGHDHVAGLGHLGRELRRRGLRLTPVTVVPEHRFGRPDVSFPTISASDWAGIITLGAPWPRDRISSWSSQEVELLREAHDHEVPILGICFGAQLLAEALGGSVTRLATPRIGWYEIESSHAVLDTGPWFQWHRNQIEPPAGATVLATSVDGCEAFVSESSLGVQFHPEMTAELLGRWLSLPDHSLPDARLLLKKTARHDGAELERRVRRFADLLHFP